jgi:electron transfer flavoprotein beta subunit
MPDDPKIVAGALANIISVRDFDLVLTGEVAIDSAGAQVPQRLGVLLNWPCVTGVEELKVTPDGLIARHPVEQGDEIHRCSLPAIVGINRRIGEPRYPSFRGIMKAKRKPIEKEAATLEVARLQIASLAVPASRSDGKILAYEDGVAEQVIALLREEAKVI